MQESGGRRQALAGVASHGQLVAFIDSFATRLHRKATTQKTRRPAIPGKILTGALALW
jgi:hypothetical protein